MPLVVEKPDVDMAAAQPAAHNYRRFTLDVKGGEGLLPALDPNRLAFRHEKMRKCFRIIYP